MADQSRPVGRSLPHFTAPPRPGPDEIAGRFARLERLDPARHAADLFAENQADDEVWDYLGYGPFATLEDYRAWQSGMAALSDPYFYAIRDLADDRIKGVEAFLRIDAANGVIELGHIQLSPALQRSAAASEAMMLMIRWALDSGYRRFEWKCDSLNAPSRRAAVRLGFSFEGVFRQHMITKGRNRDTAWFSIIDSEWPVLRAAYDAWLAPSNFDAEGQQRRSLSELTAAALPGRDSG